MHRTLALALLVALYLCGAFAVHRLYRLFWLVEGGVDPALLGSQRPLMIVMLTVAIAGAAIVHALLARTK